MGGKPDFTLLPYIVKRISTLVQVVIKQLDDQMLVLRQHRP
jgi:hypothetical protein